MLSRDIFGLPTPEAGPVFAVALAVHIAAGLTAVVAGGLAATARKRPGRHPKAGRSYLIALGFVFAWPTRHAMGMGGSYIALLTGFYVDNGPFLPIWGRPPTGDLLAAAQPGRRTADLVGASPVPRPRQGTSGAPWRACVRSKEMIARCRDGAEFRIRRHQQLAIAHLPPTDADQTPREPPPGLTVRPRLRPRRQWPHRDAANVLSRQRMPLP
jgi:hypothetical protein